MQAEVKGHRGKFLNILIAASLIAFFHTTTSARAEQMDWHGGASPIENPQYHAELLQKAFIIAAEKVKPSVVRISATVIKAKEDSEGSGWSGAKAPERGSGSGFIIDEHGYILTSNHVVDPGGNIDVFTAERKRYKAKVVGRDVITDLAVIRLENLNPGDQLVPLKFGDSDAVRPGQWSMAIGAPYGLEQSVTVGIISGLRRSNMGVAPFENYIQTDAAINPGNSGGPLINLSGEVIGVIAARLGKSGIGFAVPVNMARYVALHLIKDGRVVRGQLGVKIQSLNYEMAQKFGLRNPYGALVADVKSGGPAYKGGLKRGDVVVEFNSASVKDAKDLQIKTEFSAPGTLAILKVIRDREPITLSLQVGEYKEELTQSPAEKTNTGYGLSATPMSLREVNFETDKGSALRVSAVDRGSRAELDGLKSGDIILEIDGEKVDCMEDFKRAMQKIHKGENLLGLVLRNGSTFYTILRAP